MKHLKHLAASAARATNAAPQLVHPPIRGRSHRADARLPRRRAPEPATGAASAASAAPVSPNYGARVIAGEFVPTALHARELARQRGTTLHQLAHELGHAGAPPRTRSSVNLRSVGRAEIARRTGYSLSDVSRFFARRHPPTVTKLARIAAVYGCWLDDLLDAMGW